MMLDPSAFPTPSGGLRRGRRAQTSVPSSRTYGPQSASNFAPGLPPSMSGFGPGLGSRPGTSTGARPGTSGSRPGTSGASRRGVSSGFPGPPGSSQSRSRPSTSQGSASRADAIRAELEAEGFFSGGVRPSKKRVKTPGRSQDTGKSQRRPAPPAAARPARTPKSHRETKGMSMVYCCGSDAFSQLATGNDLFCTEMSPAGLLFNESGFDSGCLSVTSYRRQPPW